ncbi:sin3A-associated protein 130 isoform X5 [Oratosquilla oratoria]|uniref:sin3A-associated protein 130 isoform X5 n=1 Tax=Oratosquilla oratoria TaxID=337810 RepID=UPI003F7668E7
MNSSTLRSTLILDTPPNTPTSYLPPIAIKNHNYRMTGRSGLVSTGGAGVVASVASSGTGSGAAISMSSGQGAQDNQPIDLAQKGGGTRPQETSSSGSNIKGTLLHYTTGNVTQILTTSGTTAHVVTAKPVGRAENVGVGGQTLALVSRHSTPGALNLVSGGSGPTGNVRNPHPSMSMAASQPPAAHLTYHIPRGPAAVANMTPRSQPVATPMVRPVGQQLAPPPAMGPGPRGGVVGQRVMPVSTSGGWARTTASSVHGGNKVGGTTILPPGVTATAHMAPRSTTPSPRPPQGSTSITTYHSARPPMTPANNVRGVGTTTVRQTLTNDQLRSTVPKAVQISQPVIAQQKYGPASGGRGVGSGGNVAVTGTTLYSPGAPLVTTLPSVSLQSPGLHPPTPTIAVRITSAPVQTVSSAGQTSQAGSNIGAVSITTPSCNPATSVLTHHMTAGQRTQTEQHTVPLKTPVLRTPISAHQMGKQTQGLAFSSGPKVITQPAQGPPLALPQITGITGIAKPPVSVHSVQPTHTVTTQARQGVVAASGRVSMSGNAIPVAKVHPQQAVPSPTGNTVTIQGPAPHPTSNVPTAGPHVPAPSHSPRDGDTQTLHSVFLHRTPGGSVPGGGPGATVSGEKVVTTIAPYNISANTTYYYEAGQNAAYQVGGPIIPHTLNSSHYVPTTVAAGAFRTNSGVLPQTAATAVPDQAAPPMKPNSSPRPTILRKRNDNDGTPLKAAKNLTSALSMPPMPSPPSPKRPDSRGNGNASSGSTTISATSSPDSSLSGLQIEELETSSGGGINSGTPPNIKQEPPEDANIIAPRPLPLHSSGPPTSLDSSNTLGTNTSSPLTSDTLHISTTVRSQTGLTVLPADGLSPRKKPRKQQLNSLSSVLGSCRTGNELQEARSSEDDLDHHTKKIKKEPDEDQEGSDESSEKSSHTMPIITRRPQMSLLTSYRQSWKPRHNHFTRHTEVRPKEERRLTVNEIANQRMAMQRVNGWKVMHVSGQVEDLTDLEGEVVERLQILLTALEKRTHPRKPYKEGTKRGRVADLMKVPCCGCAVSCDTASDPGQWTRYRDDPSSRRCQDKRKGRQSSPSVRRLRERCQPVIGARQGKHSAFQDHQGSDGRS